MVSHPANYAQSTDSSVADTTCPRRRSLLDPVPRAVLPPHHRPPPARPPRPHRVLRGESPRARLSERTLLLTHPPQQAYCNLFNLILNSSGPVPLTLPIDWIYNMSVSRPAQRRAPSLTSLHSRARKQHRRVCVPVHQLRAVAEQDSGQDGGGKGDPCRVGPGTHTSSMVASYARIPCHRF